MQSPPVVVLQNVPIPSEARNFLEELASTEGRLAVTAVIALVTVLLVWVVVPIVVRKTSRLVARRFLSQSVSESLDETSDVLPITTTGLLVRSFQVTAVAFAALSLLVVWGLFDLVNQILTRLGFSILTLAQVVGTIALGIVAYVAADVLEESIAQFAARSDRVTDHQQEIMLRVGNLGLIVMAVFGALTIWGVNLSGLLVGAGFLGIVVGLAARQTLGSLIAGFVLMFSRPFTIGDWVEIGDDEGIVTDITIVNTRLENFDGETIVIPNDRVSNQSIVNRSERGHLRLKLDVGVDYDTDTDHAVDVAMAAIESIDFISETPPPRVVPKSFGDSAVVLELRFWIDRPMPPRKWQAIDNVVRAVKTAFDEEGIKIPFPQRELSGRAETGGFRVHDEVAGSQGDGERSVEPSPDE
ncbi:MAG: small-conductance mechanosensitive channel [Haloarculaceae archaeon]|jgi:small-conductance mechanosensitive channel